MDEPAIGTVISFSYEKTLLDGRESALRSAGYNVFSTSSESCVRFEIQMGQCGILLLCYTIRDAVHHDLSCLFAQHCPEGVIAFVMHPVYQEKSQHAHICLLDSELPNKLKLAKERHSRRKSA